MDDRNSRESLEQDATFLIEIREKLDKARSGEDITLYDCVDEMLRDWYWEIKDRLSEMDELESWWER